MITECCINWFSACFGRIIEYFKSANAIGLITNIVLSGLMVYWHQKQKGKLDKDVERYKSLLQVEFIKSEMKTKQLFNIYPILFAKFKKMEGILFTLKGPVARLRSIIPQDIKEAEKTFIEVNNYFVFNLLFFSQEVAESALAVRDAMTNCLYNELSKEEAIQSYEEIERLIKVLEAQLKKELHNDSKMIK